MSGIPATTDVTLLGPLIFLGLPILCTIVTLVIVFAWVLPRHRRRQARLREESQQLMESRRGGVAAAGQGE